MIIGLVVLIILVLAAGLAFSRTQRDVAESDGRVALFQGVKSRPIGIPLFLGGSLVPGQLPATGRIESPHPERIHRRQPEWRCQRSTKKNTLRTLPSSTNTSCAFRRTLGRTRPLRCLPHRLRARRRRPTTRSPPPSAPRRAVREQHPDLPSRAGFPPGHRAVLADLRVPTGDRGGGGHRAGPRPPYHRGGRLLRAGFLALYLVAHLAIPSSPRRPIPCCCRSWRWSTASGWR